MNVKCFNIVALLFRLDLITKTGASIYRLRHCHYATLKMIFADIALLQAALNGFGTQAIPQAMGLDHQ